MWLCSVKLGPSILGDFSVLLKNGNSTPTDFEALHFAPWKSRQPNSVNSQISRDSENVCAYSLTCLRSWVSRPWRWDSCLPKTSVISSLAWRDSSFSLCMLLKTSDKLSSIFLNARARSTWSAVTISAIFKKQNCKKQTNRKINSDKYVM